MHLSKGFQKNILIAWNRAEKKKILRSCFDSDCKNICEHTLLKKALDRYF